MEGPESVAAVFVEPVQNAGGCFPPPPGYFERLREICDAYDVLLVSDEVICAYGRLGTMFGAQKFGYQPDIITSAKGLTSGYSPLGAAIISDRIFEPFGKGDAVFPHGYTFGGHPVSLRGGAGQPGHLRARGPARQRAAQRERLPADAGEAATTCRSSATSAATATSTASSWSRTRRPRRPSTTTSPSGCCAATVAGALFENGLYCRADDRGDPVVQVAPPLICGQAEFDEMEQILRSVLTEGMKQI